jgi:hypothetical protein
VDGANGPRPQLHRSATTAKQVTGVFLNPFKIQKRQNCQLSRADRIIAPHRAVPLAVPSSGTPVRLSQRLDLAGVAQSRIAGITDALRTATIDHSKVFEVMALLSVMADTISGKQH